MEQDSEFEAGPTVAAVVERAMEQSSVPELERSGISAETLDSGLLSISSTIITRNCTRGKQYFGVMPDGTFVALGRSVRKIAVRNQLNSAVFEEPFQIGACQN